MKYYLVRAIFTDSQNSKNGEDMSPKFLLENRWKNGYENKYTNVVNNVAVGDIVALDYRRF